MIGLDSYSRQVFIYLDPILIYISLWLDCLFEIRKIAVFPLAFIAGWLQGHWWGFISRNYVVWPIFLLINVFIALKGSHFWFLLYVNLCLWIQGRSQQTPGCSKRISTCRPFRTLQHQLHQKSHIGNTQFFNSFLVSCKRKPIQMGKNGVYTLNFHFCFSSGSLRRTTI